MSSGRLLLIVTRGKKALSALESYLNESITRNGSYSEVYCENNPGALPWLERFFATKFPSIPLTMGVSLARLSRKPPDCVVFYKSPRQQVHHAHLWKWRDKNVDVHVIASSETNYWTDQSGKRWRLQDMTLSHLRNTISFLERVIPAGKQYSSALSLFDGGCEPESLASLEESTRKSVARCEDKLVLLKEELSRRRT